MSIGVYIVLSQGYVAIVDKQDCALADMKWSAFVKRRADGSQRVYAVRGWTKENRMLLHQAVFGPTPNDIDHRDGDGLNNRRANLREATRSRNSANARKRTGTASIFKGLYFHRKNKTWVAAIMVNGKRVHIGTFREEINAAQAYNFVADEYFGQFARFNLPTQGAQ